MKKRFSVIALLLAVIMIAMCCVACGDDAKNDSQLPTSSTAADVLPTAAPTEAPTEAPAPGSIVGSWRGDFDLTKMMFAVMDSYEDSGLSEEQFNLIKKLYKDLSITMTLEFKDDSTCVSATDKASADAVIEQLKANIKNNLGEVLSMYGVTESELADYGYTTDTFVESFLSELDTDSFEVTATSQYRLDGNKLYMYEEGNFDDSQYVIVDVTASTLSITDIVSPDIDDAGSYNIFSKAILPMVFKRV